MAITALENFSCLPADMQIASSTAINGIPFGSYTGNLTSLTGATFVRDLEGGKRWITHDRTSGSPRWLGLSMAEVLTPGSSRIVIGWRARRQSNAYAVNVFSTGSTVLSYTWPTATAEVYFEVVIDRSDWSCQLWANGRLSATATITNTTDRNTYLAASGWLMLALCTQSNMAITDVYVVQDTSDDTPNGRIGPQDITDIPLEVNEESANGTWDYQAMQDILTRTYGGPDSGTRVTGEGVTASIQLKPAAGYALPNDTAVNGLGVFIGATHRSGSPADIETELSRGEHSDVGMAVLSEASTGPAIRLINNTRSAAEERAVTALDGLTLDLRLSSR